MATPKDTADVGRLEHEIAQVRGDLGRTVQEIGTRLTPASLMEQARRSLRDGTVETTKAVAQSATAVASDVASRTRDVALDARDHVQAHPYASVTDGTGAFSLKGLPPGTYEIEAWHEKLGRSSQKVTVGPKEKKTIEFVLKAS